jgi:quercetin dioxygenase-like cupin family protein
MHKINIDEIPKDGINSVYMQGVSIRYLVVEEFGAPNFEMRYFELQKGAMTSLDQHPYEHEVYVLKGKGKMLIGDEEHELRSGDAVLIEPNEIHRLFQSGEQPFGFLCVVPNGVSQSKKKVNLNY